MASDEGKNSLEQEVKVQKEKIREVETQNQKLNNEVESLKNRYGDTKKKLDTTAERIQGLLTKLESA